MMRNIPDQEHTLTVKNRQKLKKKSMKLNSILKILKK